MKELKQEILHYDDKTVQGAISVDCVCSVGSKKYFWGKNTPGLFEYENGVCRYILREPDVDFNEKMGYGYCCAVEDFIVFAPFWCSSICLFNYKTGKADFIPIENPGRFGRGICAYNGKVIFFCSEDTPLLFNVNDKTTYRVKELSSVQFQSIVYQYDRFVYTITDQQRSICQIDLFDMSINKIQIGKERLSNLCLANGFIWIATYDGKIIKYDIETGKKQYLGLPDSVGIRANVGDIPAIGDHNMLCVGNSIYCAPGKIDSFLKIDISKNTVEAICKITGTSRASALFAYNDYQVGCVMYKQGDYNVCGGLIINQDDEVEDRVLFHISKESKYLPGIISETEFYSITEYIYAIVE